MALIIKGDMPQKCDWCFYRWNCEVRMKHIHDVFGKYDSYTDPYREQRLPNCPLVEIPDEHGRLKDESVIIENMGNAFDKLFPLDGKHKQTIVSDCHVEFMRAVFKAPVVVEASTDKEESK